MRLSKSAYARHRGVTEGAVRYAIKAGRISVEADGKIDPGKADIEWEQNTHKGYNQPKNQSADSDSSDLKTVNPTNYQQAKTAHEVLKAQTAKIQLDKLKGSLVDREKALAHVFRLARVERDSWINFPARVSAEMAAKLGVDEMILFNALTEYITRHFEELSEFQPRID